MNNVLIDHQTFNIGDKVRVLKNDAPPETTKFLKESAPRWKSWYRGVVVKVYTKGWLRIWDYEKYDGNLGTLQESVEDVCSDCKMTRVIKD